MSDAEPRLVWVDLEMTGLEPETCSIVEIATLVTDANLNVIAEGPSLVIRPPEGALATMSDFVRELHTRSGLLERIERAGVERAEAEAATVGFLEQHCEKGTSPLCGNSVWKDRAFLEREMPRVIAMLHYRMIDVSTIKELVRRWYPSSYQAPKKREVHRALDDIRESLEELRWYRERVFAKIG